MAQGGSTCIDCIKCDSKNSITSFPLKIDRTPDEAIDYGSVDEPITMNFQWATRSIAPTFISGTSLIDEGSGSGATNVSTLNFKNINYKIHSVQIASDDAARKGTHNNWILPSTLQSQNKEDLIITFYNPNPSVTYNYIVFVIPILRTASNESDPQYLSALSSSTNGSYSLSSCLPQKRGASNRNVLDENALFAYYATCIDGYTQHKTPENIYVFVAVKGISVSSSLMDTLAKKATASGNFPNINLPFIMRFARQISNINVSSEFSKYVLTTRHLLNYSGIKQIYKDLSINERTDSTSAYQCVPLDPDTDVTADGNISFDLESGQVLSEVLKERSAARAVSGLPNTSAGQSKLQSSLGSALGVIMAILIIFIGLYFAYTLYLNRTLVNPIAETPLWVRQLPLYGLMIVVAGLVGFSIGATITV